MSPLLLDYTKVDGGWDGALVDPNVVFLMVNTPAFVARDLGQSPTNTIGFMTHMGDEIVSSCFAQLLLISSVFIWSYL